MHLQCYKPCMYLLVFQSRGYETVVCACLGIPKAFMIYKGSTYFHNFHTHILFTIYSMLTFALMIQK